jgi:hypothetical protein
MKYGSQSGLGRLNRRKMLKRIKTEEVPKYIGKGKRSLLGQYSVVPSNLVA